MAVNLLRGNGSLPHLPRVIGSKQRRRQGRNCCLSLFACRPCDANEQVATPVHFIIVPCLYVARSPAYDFLAIFLYLLLLLTFTPIALWVLMHICKFFLHYRVLGTWGAGGLSVFHTLNSSTPSVSLHYCKSIY
jgi:hypothetical protein